MKLWRGRVTLHGHLDAYLSYGHLSAYLSYGHLDAYLSYGHLGAYLSSSLDAHIAL